MPRLDLRYLNFRNYLIVIFNIFLVGCSTLTGSGTVQTLSVYTYNSDGDEIVNVVCVLENDVGKWQTLTPSDLIVLRSNKELSVICSKENVNDGVAIVESNSKGSMLGNIIIGGGLGALVDHNNGSGYEYPKVLRIMMGTNQHIKTSQKF